MQIRILTGMTMLAMLLHPLSWADEVPQAVVKTKEMVVSANPLASEAGAEILRKGGTAADAMVAVQAVLGLVEPQSSGLGGGAFVVYYDARTGETTTIDAREKAPAAATEDRFVGVDFGYAWQSGLSVGVPGTPRMMEYVHRKFGQKKWGQLFAAAENLASKGFPMTEQTSAEVDMLLAFNPSCDLRLTFRDPAAFEYFAEHDGMGGCSAKAPGTIIKNPDYVKTLNTLAKHGADGFYYGEIAENIAAAVQGDLSIGGDMTVEDLADYDVVERPPVCFAYRGHNVCGMGPPSSGAIAVGQILGILENFDLGDLSPLDVETVHLFSQAGRLAFADRSLYVGDSDFVTVPVNGMLDKTYLAERAALIGDMDMGQASAGTPPGDFDPAAPDSTAKNSGTSHVSIVDRWGNALSMTTSIEGPFGNGVMVNGFLLNNQLTDFSFEPFDSNGIPVANRVQPGKRPRSSMSPTIVFDEQGEVEIVTGSPGGSRIIGYVAQSVMNMIDFGLDPQQAINVPHYMNRNGPTEIEMPIPGITLDYDSAAMAAALEDRGHNVEVSFQNSGLAIIQTRENHPRKRNNGQCNKRDKMVLVGGADLRRDGTASGK